MRFHAAACPRSTSATRLTALRRSGVRPPPETSVVTDGDQRSYFGSFSTSEAKRTSSGNVGSSGRTRGGRPSAAPGGTRARISRPAASASTPSSRNVAATRISSTILSVNACASTVSISRGCPLRLITNDPSASRSWLARTSSRVRGSSSMRESDAARLGKFCVTSTIICRGSSASTTRCVACSPSSLMSHTFSVSSRESIAARWSRKDVSSGVRSGYRSARRAKLNPRTSSSARGSAPAPESEEEDATPSRTRASSVALYSMFLMAISTPYPAATSRSAEAPKPTQPSPAPRGSVGLCVARTRPSAAARRARGASRRNRGFPSPRRTRRAGVRSPVWWYSWGTRGRAGRRAGWTRRRRGPPRRGRRRGWRGARRRRWRIGPRR